MQRIIVDNFGPIKHAEIEVRQFTVVIGEQASGKTYLSKLVYFFQKLPYTLYDFAFFADNKTFIIEDFQNKISREFLALFNSISINKQEFALVFKYGTGVYFEIYFKSNTINVECSNFEKIIKILSKIDVFDPKLVRAFYRIFNSDESSFNPFNEYREAYIPAGRAFTNIFPSDT
ncbi:MAG: ATP-binding protein, partial [Chlorobi bacterium]|nr:ATP-binding protein [Chlorobiota bacterium]